MKAIGKVEEEEEAKIMGHLFRALCSVNQNKMYFFHITTYKIWNELYDYVKINIKTR